MIERRRHSRVKIDCPVYFIGSDKDGNVTAQDVAVGLNISENGILIESGELINARFIQIMVTSRHKTTLKVRGEIVYSIQAEQGKFKTGIVFGVPPETAASFVNEAIQMSSPVDDRSN